MRKSLVLAAALTGAVAVGLGSTPAKADQFTISASSPGSVNFSGSGTAQFNNSLGTNNSFQVGSATSLGVNASSSSTPEYGVASTADLKLSGTTQLQQQIGTSGTESGRTHSRAHESASSRLAEQGWGSSWSADVNVGGKTYDVEADWKHDRQQAYESEYSSAYSTYSGTASSNDGTISGSFKTVENSRAGAGGNSSDWESTATTAVNVEYGADYANRSGSYSSMSEVDYKAARESAYNREYASASASNNRFSDSQVTVEGIGSDASIVAKDDSTFSTVITQNSGGTGGSTATAQGSAGASLSSVSLANQSQSQTASAFIQSFGGEGGVGVGTTTTTTQGTLTNTVSNTFAAGGSGTGTGAGT